MLAPRPNAVRPYTGPRIPDPESRIPSPYSPALKFVIHFVGDLHQPLHVADNGDKGGSRTAPTSCGVWMRSFGVRQLAAAFLPASSLAGISTRAQIPASKLAGVKAAASCRTPKRAASAQALGVGHRAAPTHQPQLGGASSGWREASPKSSCLVFLIEQTPQASTYYPSQRPGI